jgi:serine/threonine-protein kinase RIO1
MDRLGSAVCVLKNSLGCPDSAGGQFAELITLIEQRVDVPQSFITRRNLVVLGVLSTKRGDEVPRLIGSDAEWGH